MRRPSALLLAVLPLTCILLAGCATSPLPGGKRYGLDDLDAWEAVARSEGREALAYYEARGVELERGGRLSKAEAAKAYGAAALVAQYLGAYQRGIRYALRAMDLLKDFPQYQQVHEARARLRAYLGYTYAQVGDLEEARRQFEAGLKQAKGSTDLFNILATSSTMWTGLSSVAFLEGDFQRTIDDGKTGIRLNEDFLSRLEGTRPWNRRYNEVRERHLRVQALGLIIIGGAQWKLGILDDAERSFHRAVRVSKEVKAQEFETLARGGLAEVLYSRGHFSRAESEGKEALAQSARRDLSFFTTFILSRFGVHAAEQGRHEEAVQAYQKAMGLVEEVRSQLQEPGLRGLFLENKQAIYHGAVLSSLALGKPEQAFSYAERGRARAFLDLLGNQTTLSKGKTRALVEEEVRLRNQLSEARAIAQDVLGVGDPTRARDLVETAERAYRAFLDRVRKENLEQASLMAVEPVTLQEVQGLLPGETTLLEYLVTETETVLWVVDGQRVEALRLPIPRAALTNLVREFRQAIADRVPIEQVEERARGLHERLLAAARPHVRSPRLLIVPHDVLHYLPFGALRSPQGRWLVEDFTLATLPSASVLKFLQGKGAGASDRVLAVGNPDVGAALNLRYAEREARAVGERLPGVTVLVRENATEARVKTLATDMGLLHFATHGELNEQDPLASALLLVPDGPEDGRLEVREIFGLDLHARLVVLSACQTGLGKLSRGDELVGLQRAFLYAGTPAVVTTLWKVDDRSSFLLMREFYDRLQTRGPAEALGQAQRETMKEFPHPFAWAAFGLTGTPR